MPLNYEEKRFIEIKSFVSKYILKLNSKNGSIDLDETHVRIEEFLQKIKPYLDELVWARNMIKIIEDEYEDLDLSDIVREKTKDII